MLKSGNIYVIPFILAVALAATGCVATQEDVGGLYARQNQLESRLDRLSDEMNVIKTRDFGTASRDSNLIDEIFNIETKISDLERQIDGMNRKLNMLERNVERMAAASVDIPEQPKQDEQVAVTSPVDVDIRPPRRELTDFDRGYRNLSEAQYSTARQQFNSYIRENPDSSKVPDALFWIADSYYREGKYEDAILEYQKLIDRKPDDSRVPLAYLKQGLALMNLDKNREAALFFETLIDRHPETEEADQARMKLRELD